MASRFFGFFGRAVCHQLSERSFYIAGHKLAFCSRCLGIYLGFAACFALLAVLKRLAGNKPPSAAVNVFFALCFAPMMFDALSSAFGLRETNNALRFITGLLFGLPVPVYFVTLKNFSAENPGGRAVIKPPEALCLLVWLPAAYFIVTRADFPAAYYLVQTVAIGSLVLLFYSIARLVLSGLKRFRRAAAFALALAVLSLMSVINHALTS